MKRRPPLPQSIQESLARQYREGRTIQGLAKKYRRSLSVISRALHKAGAAVRKRGRPAKKGKK